MSIPKNTNLEPLYPKNKNAFGILGIKVLNRCLFKSPLLLNSLNKGCQSFEQLQGLLQSFEQADPL